MDSILQDEKVCYLCGRNGNGDPLQVHHIFFGIANRKLSEEDGLKVWLCGSRCHEHGYRAVHQNRTTDLYLKRKGQRAWEERYGTREEFIKRYGKNYL